jgi:transposase-like protein
VKLDFELDYLRKEVMKQSTVVTELQKAVDEVKNEIFHALLVRFQNWFSCHLTARY